MSPRSRRELWWHGKVTSEMHLKRGEGMGGVEGMDKKGQMVPLGSWRLMGVFMVVTVGWGEISIVTTLLSQLAPSLNGGSPNLTPAATASVLLPSLVLLLPSLAGWLAGIQSPAFIIAQQTKCTINQISLFLVPFETWKSPPPLPSCAILSGTIGCLLV